MNTAPQSHAAPAYSADVMVVGAGPAGLFTVFELGLLGLSAVVVDALPKPGGQLAALYPDKPIYDVPALRQCTGHELVQRLLDQIQPFATQWALGQAVTAFSPLEGESTPGLQVQLGNALTHRVKALVIAAGVGAFAHRQLECPDLAPLRGLSVLTPDAGLTPALEGRRVVVAGGDEVAIDTALAAQALGAASVHLLHRREALDATDDALGRLAATPSVVRLIGQITQAQRQGDALKGLCISRAGQADVWHLADVLIECLGLLPQLGPLAEWGLAMHKKQIRVSPEHMATSVANVYAVGDMAHYPGKRKLIVSAFHEATLAAYAVAERVLGGAVPFEYTTASARLQARLGVVKA